MNVYLSRHVIVPKDMAKLIATKKSLMSESEWRAMGIQQSQGWIHYMYHKPGKKWRDILEHLMTYFYKDCMF